MRRPELREGRLGGARLLAGAVIATTSFAGNSQVPTGMEKIEVFATPLPDIGAPLRQVPANVQVSTGQDLRRQRNLDLTEFLDQNAGSVTINPGQNNPFQPDLAFRGFLASPLLGTPQGLSVFLDGVRINEPFGDVVNWDLVPKPALAVWDSAYARPLRGRSAKSTTTGRCRTCSRHSRARRCPRCARRLCKRWEK